jgi:CRISP-associated protein Cas1
MIKRILYFSSPTYLKVKDAQLIIELPETKETKTAVIEDIGVIVLDNPQITLTHGVIARLLDNNTALITCDDKHMPTGYLLPLESHTEQSERFRHQIEATQPLKKQLWQQTITAKIRNQSFLLNHAGHNAKTMERWSNEVKAGDAENHEARAAAHYWQRLFQPNIDVFYRDRYGDAPNNLLNYGYAIMRGIVARGLVASGLLPTLGIHHHNKYNAYCLADDIMEPFRPFVDKIVYDMVAAGSVTDEITREQKAILLSMGVMDIYFDNRRSPLMVGLQTTTASLAKCFMGESRKIIYPTFD